MNLISTLPFEFINSNSMEVACNACLLNLEITLDDIRLNSLAYSLLFLIPPPYLLSPKIGFEELDECTTDLMRPARERLKFNTCKI